jgi:hypothetical protein
MRCMFPFDSEAESFYVLLVPAILLLYAIILMKLKPSEESDLQPDRLTPRAEKSAAEPGVLKKPVTLAEARKVGSRESTSKPQKVSKELTKSDEPKTQIDMGKTVKVDDAGRKRSFFLFGEKDFGGCPHKLGHLSTLPKSTPIPEECFGCPQILECIKLASNK